jgi:16S rRNA (cytosine967-C5)-methyltransferase
VLDLCAAPGGKAAVLAGAGASVVARDVDDRRLERVTETLARLGVAERVTLSPGRGGEGLEPASFDAVLVDAPCSNTGVLAKRPGARWRFSTESQASLVAVQEGLLEDGARCVRPGGRLVYSTCSIEPEENQRRVRAFLARHAELELEEELEALPDVRGPTGPLDGGYAARMRRKDA